MEPVTAIAQGILNLIVWASDKTIQ